MDVAAQRARRRRVVLAVPCRHLDGLESRSGGLPWLQRPHEGRPRWGLALLVARTGDPVGRWFGRGSTRFQTLLEGGRRGGPDLGDHELRRRVAPARAGRGEAHDVPDHGVPQRGSCEPCRCCCCSRRSCSSTPRCGRWPAISPASSTSPTLGDLLPARRACSSCSRMPALMRAAQPLRLVGRGRRARRRHAGRWRARPPPADGGPVADRPTTRQRVNIGLVTIFSQAIQITLVGARPHRVLRRSSAFLAIPEDDGGRVDDARRRRRARPLVTSAGATLVRHRAAACASPRFLGAFSGDVLHRPAVDRRDAYREEFADDVAPAVAPSSRRALHLPAGAAGARTT